MASKLFALLLVAAACAHAAADTNDGFAEHVKNHVRFHVFTKDTAELSKGVQLRKELDKEDILESGFNAKYPTKVIIHGFTNDVESPVVQNLKDAYFSVTDEVNVIAVDWSDLNPAPLYLAGTYNAGYVGRRTAELLDFLANEGLLSFNNVHIIGHSLGAHVAGVAGESVTAGRLLRITGLDPARPLINYAKEDGRLTADDAELVDVIHTNAGLLGGQPACGHVDFYPAGGKFQPGCLFDIVGTCSHQRSHLLFAESITNPNAFADEAWKCVDEWKALKGACTSTKIRATLGEFVSFPEGGSYYLDTAASSPYSLV